MSTNIFDVWQSMARSMMTPLIGAPNNLTQSILPMSLLTINETNSGSPDTEAAIVAKASYGRQIGRLVDAVEALIDERPEAVVKSASKETQDAFAGLKDIAVIVAKAKLAAAVARLDGIKADLELVRTGAPDAFADHRAAIREVLDRSLPAKPVTAVA